eukprot:4879644-Amphidinium_carterae.2
MPLQTIGWRVDNSRNGPNYNSLHWTPPLKKLVPIPSAIVVACSSLLAFNLCVPDPTPRAAQLTSSCRQHLCGEATKKMWETAW